MEGLGKGVNLYQSGKERQNDLFEGLHAAIRGPNLKHPCISAIILGWIVFTLAFFLLDILLHLMPNTVVLLLLTILPASLGNTAVYTRMKWNLEVVEEMEESQGEVRVRNESSKRRRFDCEKRKFFLNFLYQRRF